MVALDRHGLQSRMLDDVDAALVERLVAEPYRVFGVNMHARDRQLQEYLDQADDGPRLWDLVVNRLAVAQPAPTGPGRSARQFRNELNETMDHARLSPPLLAPLLPRARMSLLVVPHRKQAHRDLDK